MIVKGLEVRGADLGRLVWVLWRQQDVKEEAPIGVGCAVRADDHCPATHATTLKYRELALDGPFWKDKAGIKYNKSAARKEQKYLSTFIALGQMIFLKR